MSKKQTKMKISEAIKLIRWELRLSQKKLCDELHCSQASLSSWELGKVQPIFESLQKICAFAKKNGIELNLF